ncbi:MAG: hypothetical protein HY010_14625 [Acidobacteria bacterium]|nr:hypothetical protein [Acidobacteriota bacterium]
MQGMSNVRMLSVRAAIWIVLAATLALAAVAQAQSSKPNTSATSRMQPTHEASKPTEKQSIAAQEEKPGGPKEGIQVHGHWVIDVRNPDGKLVTHREFENAYAGDTFLPRILSRQNSVGLWGILIGDGGGVNLFSISEPNDPGFADSKNLILSISGQAFVLRGSLTALREFGITLVMTEARYCDPNTAPVTPCLAGAVELFTTTHPSPPIGVASGQIVQVTVTISFS